MYAIAHNRLIDALRAERRRLLREVQATLHAEPSGRAPQERAAVLSDLRRAVERLPDRQRQVIELLKFEDLSVRDVANRLGMSEANVKVTAHRGYRALRHQIEEWTRED